MVEIACEIMQGLGNLVNDALTVWRLVDYYRRHGVLSDAITYSLNTDAEDADMDEIDAVRDMLAIAAQHGLQIEVIVSLLDIIGEKDFAAQCSQALAEWDM